MQMIPQNCPSLTLKMLVLYHMIQTFLAVSIISSLLLRISFHHYLFIADAEIPKNPVVALEQNAMKVTRQEAVKQVKQMMNLIDDISSTTIKNSVSGEEFKTKTKGVQILMTK